MPQFQPELLDVIECVDIFAEIKSTYWLVQSIQDAIARHYEGPELLEHISYLINLYSDQMDELIPKLDQAFEKVQPNIDVNQLWKEILKKGNE
jgi:hypothetical protein